MLNRIKEKEIILIAEDTIECTPFVKKKVLKVLSDIEDDTSRTAGLFKRIIIKIGAKVMIRRNIDASLGLVNGTIGTVVSVIGNISNSEYIEKIKLRLSSGLEFSIEKVNVKFQVMEKAYVIRKQFPLSLSYGITIHKSQGLSLSNAIMDIGTSIFSPGQIYVALSRVTSLEGLHLINFDPLSVKASEEAIIEYNRLKQLHKPEAEMIAVSKQKIRKVKDTPWTISKVIASVQQEPHENIRTNSAWVIRGFQNTDKVSSYANAVLQCLLHLSIVRKKILYCDKLNVLATLIHRYENGMPNLNTYAIRQYLGDNFTKNVKRDASDFLLAFCAKYDYIKSLIEHQVTSTVRCKSCNTTNTSVSNNILISIPVINFKKKSYDLNDLLKSTFSHWCKEYKELCADCTGSDMLLKRELTLTREILIIHLVLVVQDGKLLKPDFNLRAVPTTKISVNGQLYKVMNAIFHHGSCLENGHYISTCREGTSNWIEVDDGTINKTKWPRGAKNISILFMEKIKKN